MECVADELIRRQVDGNELHAKLKEAIEVKKTSYLWTIG